jgi:hypothetical protein
MDLMGRKQEGSNTLIFLGVFPMKSWKNVPYGFTMYDHM